MQKIDNRLKNHEVKRHVCMCVCGTIWISIEGMNPMHAAQEIKALGGKILEMEKDTVSGSIDVPPDKMDAIVGQLLADGWEWE